MSFCLAQLEILRNLIGCWCTNQSIHPENEFDQYKGQFDFSVSKGLSVKQRLEMN